jgi:TP901 family phage tail tape measure protein
MPTIRELVISVRAKGDTKALDDADDKAKKAKGSASSLGDELKRLAGSFAGLQVARGAWVQVQEGVKTAAAFGANLSQVASLMPGSAKRVAELREGIMALALDTGKPLEDLTKGTYQVISAFGDTADSVKILEVAAKAAVAGAASTSEALNLLSAVQNSYGDTSAKAAEFTANLAQNTVALGRTTLPELSSAMGVVAGRAAALGVTQEELFATFAANAVVMNGASTVGTGLAATFGELTRQGSPSSLAIKKMGFEGAEAAVKTMGYSGVIRELIKNTDGSAEAIAKLFPPLEAQGLVLHLVKDRTESMSAAMTSNARAATTMGDAYTEATTGAGGLAHELDRARAKVEAARVQLGEKFAPAVLAAEDAQVRFGSALVDGLPDMREFVELLAGSAEGSDGLEEAAAGAAYTIRQLLAFTGATAMAVKVLVQGIMAAGAAAAAAAYDLSRGDRTFSTLKAVNAQSSKDIGDTEQAGDKFVEMLMMSPEDVAKKARAAKAVARKARATGAASAGSKGDGASWDQEAYDKAMGVKGVDYSFGGGDGPSDWGGAPAAKGKGGGVQASQHIGSVHITINGDADPAKVRQAASEGMMDPTRRLVEGAGRLVPGGAR